MILGIIKETNRERGINPVITHEDKPVVSPERYKNINQFT
jgi:hypothetical protein